MTGAPEWMASAECVTLPSDLFFPEQGGRWQQAKAVCAVCKVRDACLQHALDNREEHGIWGGTSERERRRIIRRDRPNRVCSWCAEPFVGGPRTRYCGVECRTAARMETKRADRERRRWKPVDR